jgi:lipopolysaccharide exporter
VAALSSAPAVPAANAELGRRVGRSVLWMAANTSTLRMANFLIGLVVARLVAPYDFGVFIVAFTISTILGSLISFGFSFAIVREHDRTAQIAPTAYTLSIVMSAVVMLVMVVTAPYLASFMGAGAAAGAVRILSIYVLMAAFTSVPIALMSRDFMQRQRFVVDGVDAGVSTIVMFVLIGLGHPVLGLALSRVIGQMSVIALANRMAPERYRPGFDWHAAKQLFHFGAPLTGSRVVALTIANIDFIIVGHLLGAQQLGYYNLAFNICGWPLTVFGAILMSVTTPVLSRVRNSPSELSRHLEAGLSGISAASFFVCAMLCGLAAPLIEAVYGQQWYPAWGPLVMLSIFGAAQTVLIIFWDLLVALGMTRRLLAIQVVWVGALGPAMYFGVRDWQTRGAGFAHAVVVVCVVLPVYLLVLRARTSVGLAWFRRSVVIPALAAVVCGATAFGASHLVDSPYAQLALGLAVGTATYAVLAGRWLLRVIRSLKQMYWSVGQSTVTSTDERPLRGGTVGAHRTGRGTARAHRAPGGTVGAHRASG